MNGVNKNITMDNQRKANLVHRHVHFHYHFNVSDQSGEFKQKYPMKHSLAQKQNDMKKLKISWKDKINPQVIKLYEEIHQKQPMAADSSPRTSANFDPKTAQHQITSPFNNTERSSLTESRIQFLQQVQAYHEYLRKRNVPNLLIPEETHPIQEQQYDSINPQNLIIERKDSQINIGSQTSLEQIVRKTTDSKIFDREKIEQSTTVRESSISLKRSEIIHPFRKNKIGTLSEMKIADQNQNPQTKQKNTASQIFTKQPIQDQFSKENPQFSLFQKLNQNKAKPKLCNYQSLNSVLYIQKQGNHSSPQLNKKYQQAKHIDQYKYKLMKEERDFLKEKLIEHIATIHGHKI